MSMHRQMQTLVCHFNVHTYQVALNRHAAAINWLKAGGGLRDLAAGLGASVFPHLLIAYWWDS